jgi:hypothetical protein
MQINLDVLTHSLESWKFWLTFFTAFGGATIATYKGYQWVKGIREEDLVEVKTGLKSCTQKIEDTSAAQLRSTEFQTSAIVRELSELRDDFRAYFNPAPAIKMVAVRSKPETKRVPKKTPVKKTAPKRKTALAKAKK